MKSTLWTPLSLCLLLSWSRSSFGLSLSDRFSQRKESSSRRDWLSSLSSVGALALIGAGAAPAVADEEVATEEMRYFIDPENMFSLRIPKSYFTLRRSAKGDLPDPKTGQGRRGSSIFTAGNMLKAEIVSVERFPTRVLLEENGIEATVSHTSRACVSLQLCVMRTRLIIELYMYMITLSHYCLLC
jgi:hypothetical protein